MKKILALLLAVGVLFVCCACGASGEASALPGEKVSDAEQAPEGHSSGDSQSLTMFTARDQQSYWAAEEMLCRVSWMQAALGAQEQKNLPELMAALESVNFRCKSETEAYGKVLSADAREAESLEQLESPYFRDDTLSIHRADAQAVSILRRITAYRGGIHPDTIYEGINLDTETGKTLELSDVFRHPHKLPELLEEQLLAQYPEASFFDLSGTLEDMADQDTFAWLLEPHGVTFYFSDYALASYADGRMTVNFPFTESKLFRKAYLHREDSYVLPVPVGETTWVDLDPEDDRADTLRLNCIRGELTCQEFQIGLNGVVTQDFGFSELQVQPYLVHQAQNGEIRNYLYLSCMTENRRHTIYIYDLNGESPRLTGQINDSGFHETLIDNTLWTEAFHHPGYFRLDTRFDLLSTIIGVRGYRVDFETGDAQPDVDAYTVDSPIVLKARQAIPADILPHGGHEQLPPGTQLRFLATDGATFVDMETEKGRKCRVYVECTEEGDFINGIPFDQCLDGGIFTE